MENPDVLNTLWQVWVLVKPLLTAPAYYTVTWLSEFFESGPGFLVTAVQIFVTLIIYKMIWAAVQSLGEQAQR